MATTGVDLRTHRHPLEVGLLGGGLARGPVAFTGVVVLGASGVGVVGRLMVVPGTDPRQVEMRGLQVRIGLVLAVPGPVVGQRHDLVQRVVGAHDAGAPTEFCSAVLVDVVAQMHDGVEPWLSREVPVGTEVTGFPVGARHHAEANLCHVRGGGGSGLRLTHRRRRTGGRPTGDVEPEVVVGVRCQTAGIDLHGEVLLGAGGGDAGRDHGSEVG